MDIQEFEVAFAREEKCVRCETMEQRQTVLETISKVFPEWDIQEELLDGKYPDYLHPGMSHGRVVAYRSADGYISYDAFMEMIATENISDDDVEAGFLDVIGNSFDDLVDRFAGCIVKSRSFPELDGKKVARTIRKEESGVWIVKLEGVRAYQQLYEDEMEHPVVVLKPDSQPVYKVTYTANGEEIFAVHEDIPF